LLLLQLALLGGLALLFVQTATAQRQLLSLGLAGGESGLQLALATCFVLDQAALLLTHLFLLALAGLQLLQALVQIGQGRLAFTDGSYTYDGGFKGDQRDGQGMVTFRDGRVFEGAFSGGQQTGPGTLTFPDGRRIVGHFLEYRPHGKAMDSGPNGSFDGEWVNGVLNGPAIVTAPDGSRYEGPYVNGKREGVAVETLANGAQQQCRWVAGERKKPCNKVTKSGKSIEYH